MRNRRGPSRRIAALTLLLASAAVCGCGRTVLLADDSPLRIGPGTTGTAYQLIDGDWVLSEERIRFPEGWYAVPPRFVHPEDFHGE